MKRRRLVKLLMSLGVERNEANQLGRALKSDIKMLSGKLIASPYNPGKHPDPAGQRGPEGLCPHCGRPETSWNPQTDESHCKICGWTNKK